MTLLGRAQFVLIDDLHRLLAGGERQPDEPLHLYMPGEIVRHQAALRRRKMLQVIKDQAPNPSARCHCRAPASAPSPRD